MLRKIKETLGLVQRSHPKTLRQWRLQTTDGGLYCFFDPKVETVCIYPLTSSERSTKMVEYGSVSASVEGEGPVRPHQINLFRRFINAATI